MHLLRCGLSGCIVTHPEDPSKVLKLQMNKFSQWSQKQETRKNLVKALHKIDPDQKLFNQSVREVETAYLKKYMTLELIERCEHELTEIQKRKYGPAADLDAVKFDASVLRGIELYTLEPMPAEMNLKVVDRLMQSIALLHSIGWYHNDIHANNVMMGSDKVPRIIDWGEAEEHPLDKVTDDQENLLNSLV